MKLIETIRLPGDFPMRTSIPYDWRVFLFVASVAIACGLLAGIVPAWRASRMSLNEILRESGRSLTGGVGHNRIRNILVAGQAAGSLVVLIMAGLFLRSLQHAEKTTLGFNPDHVLNLTMDVSQLGYDQDRGANFYRQVGERIRALPGVESASFAYSVPFGYFSQWDNVWKEGQEGLPESQVPRPPHNKVDKDYFHTMGIEIVRGRAIGEQDQSTSTRVAVVNETMARRFWPGEDPVGHHFRYGTAQADPVEVVGVAKDGKYVWIAEDQRSYFYVPIDAGLQRGTSVAGTCFCAAGRLDAIGSRSNPRSGAESSGFRRHVHGDSAAGGKWIVFLPAGRNFRRDTRWAWSFASR